MEKTQEEFSRYERARILGARALQLSMDAPLLLKMESEDMSNLNFDPLRLAEAELDSGVLPISINRPMPEKTEEKLKEVKVEEKTQEQREKEAKAEAEKEAREEAKIGEEMKSEFNNEEQIEEESHDVGADLSEETSDDDSEK